jgi:hypothetical protein
MRHLNTTKFVREGNYVAEVPVKLIEDQTEWSPYLSIALPLSIEEATKLDLVRMALKQGD